MNCARLPDQKTLEGQSALPVSDSATVLREKRVAACRRVSIGESHYDRIQPA